MHHSKTFISIFVLLFLLLAYLLLLQTVMKQVNSNLGDKLLVCHYVMCSILLL